MDEGLEGEYDAFDFDDGDEVMEKKGDVVKKVSFDNAIVDFRENYIDDF